LIDHLILNVAEYGASKPFDDSAFALDPDGNNIEAVIHTPE
jgi:hypothetical protein